MTTFFVSSAAILIGEVLSVIYSRRLQASYWRTLQTHIPDRMLPATFTPSSFERDVQAIIVSVVGVPTLLLTLSAYNDSPDLSRFTEGGVLEVAAVLGTLALGAYGWRQPRPAMDAIRLLGISVPSAVLLFLNLVGLGVLFFMGP